MKKLISLLALILCISMIFTSCGGGGTTQTESTGSTTGETAEEKDSKTETKSGDTTKVNVWITGSDNIRLVYEKLVDEFNKSEENGGKYKAELQFVGSGGGVQSLQDKVLAAYKADQTNTEFDIIEAGDDQIAQFVLEDIDAMMYKLDESVIPNMSRVSAKTAVGEEYFVPYRGTTVVMAYNSEKISTPPKTTEELTQWIKDNPGRFSYNASGTGGAGDSFIRTSIYNFMPEEAIMSSDKKWMEQWDDGFNYLAEIHPNLYKSGDRVVYPNKNQGTIDLLAEGSVDLIPAWADQAITGIKNGSLPASTKIYQIDPPLNGAVNSFCIPKFGSNPDGGYAFANFMLTDIAQQILLDELAAIPLVDTANLESSNVEMIADLDVSNFRTQSVGELGKEITKRWDEEIATLK